LIRKPLWRAQKYTREIGDPTFRAAVEEVDMVELTADPRVPPLPRSPAMRASAWRLAAFCRLVITGFVCEPRGTRRVGGQSYLDAAIESLPSASPLSGSARKRDVGYWLGTAFRLLERVTAFHLTRPLLCVTSKDRYGR